MTPVVAGVTRLETGVTMLVPIVPMWVFTTEPGVTTAGLEEVVAVPLLVLRPVLGWSTVCEPLN